mgnify:FL=1
MIIHDSYNKKDLIHIIEVYSLGIDIVYKYYDKKEIKQMIEDYINNYEIEELYHLEEENKIKRLKVKEKDEILSSAKKIISFCKNGYNIKRSLYQNYFDLLKDAKIIAEYGDIPSVRRAIKLLNLKQEPKINMIISDNIKSQLKQKELLKEMSIPVLQIKNDKNILITFD